MAGQLAKRGGRRGRKRQQFSDINVTPFVDVMLVLLIVFMISAPLLTTGVAVDLPNSEAKAITEENNVPLEVTLDGEGKVFVGETEVGNEKLIPFLTEVIGQKEDQRIYIRADETLPYSKVMAVLGAINRAGFSKVALISKPAGQ